MSNQRGFTLTELLVACAVLGIVMAGLVTLQQQGQAAYLVGAARAEVQQNARHAVEMLTTELRFAQAVTAVGAGCGTGPVPTGGGTTSITFTDQGGAAVVYQLAGTDLQRDGAVVVGGVETLRIWCFDAAGALTTAPANVRAVHLQVSTQTEAGVAAYHDRNQHALYTGRARLRNL